MYGGMNKGQVVEERSALLASRGFASLALAFFGAKDLPKNYFDLGIQLMFYQKLIRPSLYRKITVFKSVSDRNSVAMH